MSRKYANILTAIWRNKEFCDLPREEQLTYLLLATQSDISAAGVLHLSVTRWANLSRGTTPAMVVVALQCLQEKRFIVFDTTTEELLVRSFVRWDGGYTNSKRLPVIERAAKDIISPVIQRVLAAELARLGLDSLSDSLSAATPKTAPEPSAFDQGEFTFPQGNSLSDTVSASDGVVVTVVPPIPHSALPNPSAPPALPADATIGQRSKSITDAYYEIEPMSNWPAVNGVVTKAIRTGRWPDDEIRAAMFRLAESSRSVTTDSLRVEIVGLPASRQGRPGTDMALAGTDGYVQSTSDRKYAAAMALADQLRAQEGPR